MGHPTVAVRESYHVVGDLSDTIAAYPAPSAGGNTILTLPGLNTSNLWTSWRKRKKERICAAWQSMDYTERLVFNKLITGGFRIGVSQKLMVRALSQYTAIDETSWRTASWATGIPAKPLRKPHPHPKSTGGHFKPYPFYLTLCPGGGA